MAAGKPKDKASARGPTALNELYKKLAPVMLSQHGDLRVDRSGYDFARLSAMVRVSGAEFAAASHDYPIVFVMIKNQPVPIALTGLRMNENLFVDARGQWAAGTYVPAYLRLYPFLLAEVRDTRNLAVFVDEASRLLSKTKGAKIYDQGQHGPALSAAVELGREYHLDQIKTRVGLAALMEKNVFTRQDLNVTTDGTKPLTLKDFWVVDRKAFSTLSDQAFLDLRAKGALELVYLHFASLKRLDYLGRRLIERTRIQARPPAVKRPTRPN